MLIQAKNYDLQVATAIPDDFDALANLYTYSLKCNPDGFIQDTAYHGPIQSICLNCKNNGGDMLVAKIDNMLVGMGGLRKITQDRAELCKLHIYPDYQGYGYGKYLVQKLLTRAGELGFQKVELHVTRTQFVAVQLYQKLGFTITNEKNFTTEITGRQYKFDTIYMEINI